MALATGAKNAFSVSDRQQPRSRAGKWGIGYLPFELNHYPSSFSLALVIKVSALG
jgi:hypothetical protein